MSNLFSISNKTHTTIKQYNICTLAMHFYRFVSKLNDQQQDLMGNFIPTYAPRQGGYGSVKLNQFYAPYVKSKFGYFNFKLKLI